MGCYILHSYLHHEHFISILGQKWCTLYLSLFASSNQRLHLQVSVRRNLNRDICHTPIFDLRPYIHTPSDPEYYLTFQRKIRQRGTLKYLIFGWFWARIFILLLAFFIYFIFIFISFYFILFPSFILFLFYLFF